MRKSPCPLTVTTARTLGEGFVDSGNDASHSDILLRKRGKRHQGTGKKDPFLSLSANVKISSRKDKKNTCCAKKKNLLRKRGERHEGTEKKDPFLSLSANVRLTAGLGEPLRLGLAVGEGGVAGVREEEEEEEEETEEVVVVDSEAEEEISSSDMLAMRRWCQYLNFCSLRPHTLVA